MPNSKNYNFLTLCWVTEQFEQKHGCHGMAKHIESVPQYCTHESCNLNKIKIITKKKIRPPKKYLNAKQKTPKNLNT